MLLDLLGKNQASQYLKDFTADKLLKFLDLVISTPAAVCKLMGLDKNAAKKLNASTQVFTEFHASLCEQI